MDQRDLVIRAQRGDKDAFALLAGLAVARLDSAARLILRDGELARDAVQDAMVRGLEGPARVARPGPVRRLAPSPDRERVSRRGETSPPSFHRSRAHAPGDAVRRRFDANVAERELVDRAVVNVDGSGLTRLSKFEPQIATVDEGHLAWSPDGTRIAFGKWLNDPNGDPGVRPVTVVDVATHEEHEVGLINPNGYSGWAWSPDGRSIVEVPAAPAAGEDADQVILIDVETGEITRPGWTSGSAPTWQRMAP